MMTIPEQWVHFKIKTGSKKTFLNWYNEFVWPEQRLHRYDSKSNN